MNRATQVFNHERAAGATLLHATVPGRLRLHLKALYRNPHLKPFLEQRLADHTAILSVRANARTGNLLVQYTDSLTPHDVLKQLGLVLDAPSHDLSRTARPPRLLPVDSLRRLIAALTRRAPLRQRDTPQSAPGEDEPPRTPWHTQSLSELSDTLQLTALSGLHSAQARDRLARYGPNRLSGTPRRADSAILLAQFNSLPVALLGLSAGVSVATGGLLDAAVILGVVGINAAIGYLTERQAEITIRALDKVEVRHVSVLRDDRVQDIALEALVPGDVLILAPGSYIAADVRLLRSHRLSVDESALTGESLPVSKNAAADSFADTPLAERRNMAFMGTHVTGGSGRGLVVATAAETELGRIQHLVGEAQHPQTPMQKQLGALGTQLALVSGAICGGVFALGLLRGYSALGMLKSSVSLAVAAVPEGLPAVATTTLAIGIREMRRHKVAIRHLDAVETLGSMEVLCLDKTGTLTENRMVVVALEYNGEPVSLQALPRRLREAADGDLQRLVETAVLCNESVLSRDGEALQFDGSPTEQALLKTGLEAGIDVVDMRRRFPTLHTRYRAEQRPYMSTLHRQPTGAHLLAVKGRPADVLSLCDSYRAGDKFYPLDEAMRERIALANERMAADALRVLGFAYREQVEADMPAHTGGLIWQGLIGMADPVRTRMPELVNTFHRAGIRTIMITGDQTATAHAVGRQLGLSDREPLSVLEASRLDALDDTLLAGLGENVHVFSRVSPAHKLTIVRALQKNGRVVGMTGDGINDSPALKAADIGVAMGNAGSDIAHSVSDVVLEDDNLHTLAVATQQGRTIYDNIRKTIHFLISTNLTEIEIMVAGIALGYGTPLNPMQLLWINLVSDIFPGLALALEASEAGVMQRPPRDPNEAIIPRRDLLRMLFESTTITGGALAAYAWGIRRYGPGPQAGTLAFTTLTVGELLHALGCRSPYRRSPATAFTNAHLNKALAGTLGAQALVSFVPALRRLLGLTPFSVLDALAMSAGIAVPLAINELSKPRVPRNEEHRHE